VIDCMNVESNLRRQRTSDAPIGILSL
jgi:hypothetical protein